MSWASGRSISLGANCVRVVCLSRSGVARSKLSRFWFSRQVNLLPRTTSRLAYGRARSWRTIRSNFTYLLFARRSAQTVEY